jgi:hypothetical protein
VEAEMLEGARKDGDRPGEELEMKQGKSRGRSDKRPLLKQRTDAESIALRALGQLRNIAYALQGETIRR